MNAMSNGRSRGQAGFSLIEVLVGLALLSLALALLPGSIRLAMQAWSSRHDVESTAALALISDALEQRIAQAVPLVERTRDGGLRVQFSGNASEIEFIGPAEAGPEGAGLYRHRIRSLEDRGMSAGIAIGMALHMPGLPAWGETTAASDTIIAGREARVRFRYFGSVSRSERTDWHAEWRRTDALPTLVEIAMEVKTGSGWRQRRSVVVPHIAVR